ncbi:hypothetical protein [Streptomyces capitiformicae]|uniref:Uncharacterized protein n=1 Tax=Streptomyces capitiformicae TaxID=2014920 RepID=A0A919GNK7_9ACTN|nr:hypothetical protein [Streptomyces capitiformicae]GHH87786.1 hypothetical protein GCM10017771_30330 [Streptomyces capitiformicae]
MPKVFPRRPGPNGAAADAGSLERVGLSNPPPFWLSPRPFLEPDLPPPDDDGDE